LPQARLLLAGARLYQIVILGVKNARADAGARLFLSWFRPIALNPSNRPVICARMPA
jgi:hypothetical protein